MDDKERKLLQHAMEIQFRHKLYCDIKFPYLQSLGIKDIVQGFGNEEIGFIGFIFISCWDDLFCWRYLLRMDR